MNKLTTECLEKRIKNCIEVGNGCVMLPVSVAEELLAYRKTVNHLLDSDGSRGRFSAMELYDARKDLELLLASTAQPVSEPYKLKDAVADIRNSGVEIDADKINAERDTLNSPVIPDGSADTKRLNWLDDQNARLNEYYGTAYGWKFDANFQRNAMMLNDCNFPVMTVRQAIDEAMLAAAPAQESE